MILLQVAIIAHFTLMTSGANNFHFVIEAEDVEEVGDFEVDYAGLPANKSRDYMAAVVAANEEFSQKLLSSHAQLGPQENLIFSPSSLSTVLTMLATGARGKALRQLQQGLSLPMQGKNVFLCMMIELHRV